MRQKRELKPLFLCSKQWKLNKKNYDPDFSGGVTAKLDLYTEQFERPRARGGAANKRIRSLQTTALDSSDDPPRRAPKCHRPVLFRWRGRCSAANPGRCLGTKCDQTGGRGFAACN